MSRLDHDVDRYRPWAAARRPRTGEDQPRAVHGELYLFGSLAIVSIGDTLIVAHIDWTGRGAGAMSWREYLARKHARRDALSKAVR